MDGGQGIEGLLGMMQNGLPEGLSARAIEGVSQGVMVARRRVSPEAAW